MNVMQILKIAKQSQEKFNEKMDWSKNATTTSGYGAAAETAPEGSSIPESQPVQEPTPEAETKPAQEPTPAQEAFSFDDLAF